MDGASHYWMAMLVSLGLLAFGVGLFVVFQRYGLGMGSLIFLELVEFDWCFLKKENVNSKKWMLRSKGFIPKTAERFM